MVYYNGNYYCGCEYHEETYICDICGKQGTCPLTGCVNYEPPKEICYDCGEYKPVDSMTHYGNHYFCGCKSHGYCPQCNGPLNPYGICDDCNGM